MSDYLLSIIIPTRNRQIYCVEVVKQVLNATDSSVEVVIQDNSDDSDLQNKIGELGSNRVIYHHENRVLSFVDNFNIAVDISHGEYLCIVGDDDGVLPNIMNAAKYTKEKGLDALIPGLNAVYLWPSESPIIPRANNGYLAITHIVNSSNKIDTMDELKKLIDNGFQDYQSTNVPRLYHGIVHRKTLEQIKLRSGAYFGGLTPDIYMAVALSIISHNVESIGFPVTISGICPRSGSAASATGAHTGELKNAPHFKGHDSYSWSKFVPEVYSVETIWADTAIHALSDFDFVDLMNKKCLKELYSRLWAMYPQFHMPIKKTASQNEISIISIKNNARTYKFSKLAKRIWGRITRKRGDVIKLYNISDINEAEFLATNILNEKGITINGDNKNSF